MEALIFWDVDGARQLSSFRVIQDQAMDHLMNLSLSRDDTRLLTWDAGRE
jgi:hypothetical protein